MKRFIFIILIFILIIFVLNYKTIFSYFSIPKAHKIELINEDIYVKKQGIVLLNQSITYSPYEGKIEFFVDELKKVPKDHLICQIETNDGVFKFYSQNSGLISKKIEELDLILDQLFENPFLIVENNLNNSVKILDNGDLVKEGEAIFKLIDNLEGYIFFKLDDEMNDFIKGRTLYLKMDTNQESFRGEIVERDKFLKVKFNKFVEYFIYRKIYIFDILIYSGETIKIPERYVKKNGIDIKDDDGFTKFLPFDGLKYIKKDGFYIFPNITENKIIFEFNGKEVIN